MKCFYLLAVSIVYLASSSLGQTAFYDAKKIASFHPTILNNKVLIPNSDTAYNLLRNYTSDKDSTKHLIGEAFTNNPFVSVPIPNGGLGIAKSVIPSIGGLDVTNLADGIAQFLIKRGKAELNVAFFNRFVKFLDSTQECRILFPKSVEVFKNVEPYRYSEFIQSLREAFDKDLSNLIVSINDLIELPKYQKLLQNLPEIRIVIRSMKIVQELSQSDAGILPDSVITQLADLSEWGQINVNLGNSWKLLNVISQSVRYLPQDTSQRWIKLSDMNALIKDSIALKIFLGLVYQKCEGIYFEANGGNASVTVQDFLKSKAKDILSAVVLIENFVTLADDLDRTIKDFKDKQKNDLLSKEDYHTYINKAINITEYGFQAANTIYKFNQANANKPDMLDEKYILIAKSCNDLYKSIYSKDYNNAVMDVYNILKEVFNPNDTKIIDAILKYGNFMASVVKAESADDVQRALEVAALPVGSYSIKQKSAWTLSLNGYIGYCWDYADFGFKNIYAHGIYAPVGLTISHGSRFKHGITLSGLVSLIDVGSIAAYRLATGTTETLKQEVHLESIFSPSAQVFFELGGYPFAVGCGWRQTPKLFYSNNTSFFTVTPKNVFNFSALLDIPIFTIINYSFIKK